MTPKSPARSRSRREPGALARLRDEWPIRAGLALSALVLAYFGMSTTMANVLVKVDPVTAHRLAPRDGRIMAAATERKFGARPDFAADSEVADLARNALRRDAMAVEALNVLGLQAQARADQEQADRLFNHSHALSRRELEPQLAKIQNAVSRGDIVEALKYYDIALRTSNKAQGMLFPVLGSAIAEPKVRSALIALLSRGTPWTEPFVESVPKSPLPKAAAQFFLEGEAAGLRVTNSEKERVVAALVAANAP